ncbi:protein ALP1-like [Xenia sp. Carnegie-2017]|uniref:protein ALP1-like n=1 Tax=Xenia sp. Carnegie-2017 TaxID=2897299 RepID=UPI001F04B0BE|nr:protein ALP1-like [Xenia sp. Carnegie-2017]
MEFSRKQLICLLLIYRRRKRRLKKYKKRFWVRKLFKSLAIRGEFVNLVQELKLHDHELFFKQFRMDPSQMEEVLSWIAPKIYKQETRRDVIKPEDRLCVTMRYLATGDSFSTISMSYRIGETTISKIVSETSNAIWEAMLEKNILNMPKAPEDWLAIAKLFEKRWNFPNCLGCIDGKHVLIQAPARSGSLFFNYKKTFSIVLLAVCNGNYQFTMVDIGEAGRQSDGGVFSNSNLGCSILKNLLPVPRPRQIDSSNVLFPFVFLGDDAFPLRQNLMKPYANPNLDIRKLVTNYRISRARRIIENSFGILAARFRIFRRPIHAKVDTVISITKACVALHNYLMNGKTYANRYCPLGFVDHEINGHFKGGGLARYGS